jgi:DNA-binding transcriptional LysR family regulator
MSMTTDPIDGIDLNSVRALVALLEERHVTRAAARLQLTQAGASRSLARLRATFDDPLLVGGAGRLLPTPRGEVLLERARAVLDQVRALLSADSFDPSRSDRSFVLLVDDYFSALLLPGLARRMQSTPNLQIRVETRGGQVG